jgi:hypothetical protein
MFAIDVWVLVFSVLVLAGIIFAIRRFLLR